MLIFVADETAKSYAKTAANISAKIGVTIGVEAVFVADYVFRPAVTLFKSEEWVCSYGND